MSVEFLFNNAFLAAQLADVVMPGERGRKR